MAREKRQRIRRTPMDKRRDDIWGNVPCLVLAAGLAGALAIQAGEYAALAARVVG